MDPQGTQNAGADVTRRLAEPMFRGKFWLQLVGVMAIFYGVMIAISIVGIIIAWLPIWIGVLLFQAAGALDQAFNGGDEQAMLRAQQKLKTYFTIMGIVTLIGLILGVLGMLFGIGGAMMGFGHMGPGGPGGAM